MMGQIQFEAHEHLELVWLAAAVSVSQLLRTDAMVLLKPTSTEQLQGYWYRMKGFSVCLVHNERKRARRATMAVAEAGPLWSVIPASRPIPWRLGLNES